MTVVSGTRTRTRSASWFKALTIEERLLSLRALPTARGEWPAGPPDAHPRAFERLTRWRSERPLKGSPALADPLILHRASHHELLAILGEPIEAVASRTPEPSWLRSLQDAFSTSATSAEWLKGFDVGPGVEFLVALERPIAWAKERLRRRAAAIAREHPGTPFDPAGAPDLLFEPLVPRLSRLLLRPLVVELHAARLAGGLPGATGEERIQSFEAGLEDPDACLKLLHDYPVLARLAITALADWVDAGVEFLARLARDWEALRRAFGFPAADALVRVNVLGDRHRGGRAVMAVTFASDGTSATSSGGSRTAAGSHLHGASSWLRATTTGGPSSSNLGLARHATSSSASIAARATMSPFSTGSPLRTSTSRTSSRRRSTRSSSTSSVSFSRLRPARRTCSRAPSCSPGRRRCSRSSQSGCCLDPISSAPNRTSPTSAASGRCRAS